MLRALHKTKGTKKLGLRWHAGTNDMKIGIILGCMYNALELIIHLTFLSIKPRARASQTANIKLQYSKELRTTADILIF